MSALDDILAFEQRLLDEILPAMRERARAADLSAAIDHHLLETKQHVVNLSRVDAFEVPPNDDLELLAEILRLEHAELAAYTFLVAAARALGIDDESVRLLRLNMEQDDYAREQAEHVLAKLLAEKVETGL